jgi:hypothetical protein
MAAPIVVGHSVMSLTPWAWWQMHSFEKFWADRIFLQNRDRKNNNKILIVQ